MVDKTSTSNVLFLNEGNNLLNKELRNRNVVEYI